MLFGELLKSIFNVLIHYGPVIIILLICLIFAFCAGFYCFALYVEEKPSQARLIVHATIVLNIIQIIISISFMPWYLVGINLIAHLIYLMIARDIPYLKISSPFVIGGLFFTIVSHIGYFIHFVVSGNYSFWMFFLNNFFTNWICPLFLIASMVITPFTMLGGDVEGETDHKSLFANIIKKIFGKVSSHIKDTSDM